jgi:hypothetical protein
LVAKAMKFFRCVKREGPDDPIYAARLAELIKQARKGE